MDAHTVSVFLNALSVLVMLVCCVAICRQTASKMQKYALLSCVLSAVCCMGFLIKVQAFDVSMYLAGQMMAYAVVPFVFFFVFLFVLEYCRFSIPSFAKAILCGLNFLVILSVLTMNYHPFFYESIQVISKDGFIDFEKSYGPLHTFAIALFVFYLVAVLVVAVVFTVKNKQRRNYAWKIMFTVAIPYAVYLISKLLDLDVDLLSTSCAVFSILMLYLIYRNKLYDIDNIMAKYSVASIEEAYIVFDDKYHIKGYNEIAGQLFPVVKTLDLDCDVRNYDTPFVAFLEGTSDEYRKDDKIYGVFIRTINDHDTPQGKVLRVEDVTIQRNYTELLQENIDRINQDLAMAKSVQESALPDVRRVVSALSQIDAAASMKTAKEVGGDFYDFYQLDDHRVVILIADVSDKGIPAALFMMRAKTTIASFVEEGFAVDEVFNRANAYLAEGNNEDMFLTAWMGVFDMRTGQMSFVNAGHNKPIMVRANGQVERFECRRNFVLAGFDQTSYALQELKLEPGDGIFLYTDGVTDATDADDVCFGEERLIACLRSCGEQTVEETLKSVENGIEDFVGTAEQFDDITMIMMRYF